MPRTTDELVAGIIEVDEEIPLTPFIAVDSSLVDEIEANSSSPPDDRLILIETWLSAHFYAIRDPRPTAEKAGPVSVNYQSKVDLGLNVTHYGQKALTLDTSGVLRSLNKDKKRASATWLGKDRESES